MRLTLTLILSLFIYLSTLAQEGSYYLAQYNLETRGLSNYNYNIVQDSRGLIYMANLKGVLVSDGLDWSIIETPYSTLALDVDDKDNLYVGGRKEIAVISRTGKLSESYQLITAVSQEIFEIKYHNNQVYFLSETALYIYSTVSKKVHVIKKLSQDLFSSILTIDGNLYVFSLQDGVQTVQDGGLVAANLKLPEGTLRVKSSYKGDHLAILSNGNYFIKKAGSSTYNPFNIKDEGYLEQNTTVNFSWVNANLLAISTINGGVAFINATTGNVEQYMNYENGLLDNEILALFVSKNNIVWCATPQGVSIIAPDIPIRNYASYKGLSGNIQVVYEFKKRLFVGTTTGLFELVKKIVFEDIVSYKKITPTKGVVKGSSPPKKRRLFKRKIKRSKTFYQKQIQKQLLSQSFEFKKIENIDAKIVQLVDFNGKLLIGSLSGVYQLDEKKVTRIFEEPVVYLYKPKSYNLLMVSTYDKKVKVLEPKSDLRWVTTGLLDGLNDFVEQIEQGENGSLWLCGADSVYRIVLNNAYSLDDIEVYPIHNPYWERIYANTYQGKTYFLNTSGYYYYENNAIKKDTVIENKIGLPTHMILSSKGKLWVNTDHFWYGRKNLNSALNFISLFENPKYISELGENKFWVVAGDNQLYKVDEEEIKSISRNFELFLEKAQKDSVALPLTTLLGNISQQSSLSFKFSSPDYTNIYQTKYQYRLVGLSSEWSGWGKKNNEISFPHLPAGAYKLEVRARDALGNIKNSDSISFSILGPYWKQSWFYLIELIFFGGLMTISIVINRKKHKFSVLSRLLTFLTLIFIVEFVQTIAEAKFETNQSPVINFFIQVAIALSILPVESILRKFITKKQAKLMPKESETVQKVSVKSGVDNE